ncbi:spore germination protein [Thermohalobacter berrensis]|uniref:Spore gernimation protein GerA n=1 Tax=Thermohalobacter berrensis TaxID=99594 RepID=A0A419T1P0_9FIRM|nr:spore germination protein [Thermohalobacter berrensis]RKD31385.1 spore gernimation protein GerA [Thermohalobacter berrensis]
MFKWFNKKKNKEEVIVRKEALEDYRKPLSKKLDTNIKLIKESIGHNPDVLIREFKVGGSNLKAAIVHIDGLADTKLIDEQILKPLMLELPKINGSKVATTIKNKLKNSIITTAYIKEVETLDKCILQILSGSTTLFINGNNKALILDTPGWEVRAPQEPDTEPAVRGPKDGFVETLRNNIIRLRRRIKDPNLVIEKFQVGRRSVTNIAMVYIRDIANKTAVDEIRIRLEERLDVDDIIDSGFIAQAIKDDFLSPFPQLMFTERPDRVVAALMEGRVAIVTDNTPSVLIAPVNYTMFIQAPEDYYESWIYNSLVRILRYITTFLSIFLPSLYVSLVSFHQGLIPTKLAITIAATREGVPFPSLIEALIMEATLEILREAGLRLPKPIGQAVGIVGGLVIGEAAVNAGIVSPIMVVIVALTAISSFATPQYSIGITFRTLRFGAIIAAGFFGLYGVLMFFILISIHVIKLKSFGVEYLAPFAPVRIRDLKDTLIRAPLLLMKRRPQLLKTQDENRRGE